MSRQAEEGPVYYREIHKNAFLRRISTDSQTGKLLPLSQKKPMWTQLCIHNGLSPYLEQYASPSNTARHNPTWRASLRTARHVSASLKPWPGQQYDFLVTTDEGCVRMLAADWDSMQDWVTTLRTKLQELKVLSSGENVYCAPPTAPVPRAGFRDPTSPLPPTPIGGPVRVPGVEIVTPQQTEPNRRLDVELDTELATNEAETHINQIEPILDQSRPNENIDHDERLHWDQALQALPSTSHDCEPKSVTKICGQNICLDDSILKRNSKEISDDDEDFFSDINKSSDINSDFKQRVVICDEEKPSTCISVTEARGCDINGEYSGGSNITVINVSNKAPHTAIPILTQDTNVFQFDFKHNVSINDNDPPQQNFVNIVNTEVNINNENKDYDTVFSNNSDYGHISLSTTSVQLPETENKESVYEKLFMASTSKTNFSNKSEERKTSLPNLPNNDDNKEPHYDYLFPTQNSIQINNDNTNIEVNLVSSGPTSDIIDSNVRSLRSNVERSHSQSSYDSLRLREMVLRNRNQNSNARRNNNVIEQKTPEIQSKPIWKRGLTELNLLSKIRNIATTKTERGLHASDNTQESSSLVHVVHRSRGESRVEASSPRRRSTSLTNGTHHHSNLQSLRVRQANTLRAEQGSGAAIVARIYKIAKWNKSGAACTGRTGDRVTAVQATTVSDTKQLAHILKSVHSPMVDILFQRVPHGIIYVLVKKTENQSIGIKLDNECQIVSVEPHSPAHAAGLPPPGQRWCVTEVNQRQLNLLKGGDEEMRRLSSYGKEVSILIQPATLVKKLRAAVRANKPLLTMR